MIVRILTGLSLHSAVRILLLLLLLFSPVVQPLPSRADNHIIYVDVDATGDNDGSSWEDALVSLQEATYEPMPGKEVWVAEGIYYPDVGFLQGDNNRESTFWLQNGMAFYGGFAGNETQRGQRDWETNLTILSGDLEQNDNELVNGILSNTDAIVGLNAYHVVTASGTDATAILNGFIITSGSADGEPVGACGPSCGGGLDSTNGSPTLNSLIFSGNYAIRDGGGMFFNGGSPTLTNIVSRYNRAVMFGGGLNLYITNAPVLTNVTFNNNSAGNFDSEEGGGGGISLYATNAELDNVLFLDNLAESAGGAFIRNGSPSFRSATFIGNHAVTDENGGGAIYNSEGTPTLVNAIFQGNRAHYRGGAIYNDNGVTDLTNAVFSGNRADRGGAFYNGGTTDIYLRNVTISGNQADSASAIYGGASSSAQVYNSIIWGNIAVNNVHVDITSGNTTFENSLIQGLNPGGTNFDAANPANAPRFVRAVDCGANGCTDDPATGADEAANDDYGDLRLRGGSPMLDAGDNDLLPADLVDIDQNNDFAERLPLDLAGGPRVRALKTTTPRVDVGAYERVNTGPTADAGGPYNAVEGGSVDLNGSASSDDGGIVNYGWDCTNNNSIDVNSASPTGSTCPYGDSGNKTLRLTVRDALDNSASASASVVVANIAPNFTAGPDQSTGAGTSKSFSLGSFTDPGAEGAWAISIDWGDDSEPTQFPVDGTGNLPNQSHTYATHGTYNVVVTVDDGEDDDHDGFQVVVNPAPANAPKVTKPASQTATAGASKNFALGSFTDAGDSAQWTVTVNWDDGSPITQFNVDGTGNLANRAHTYSAAGQYDVKVTVNDGQLSGSAEFRVTVTSVNAPEVEIFLPRVVR